MKSTPTGEKKIEIIIHRVNPTLISLNKGPWRLVNTVVVFTKPIKTENNARYSKYPCRSPVTQMHPCQTTITTIRAINGFACG
ncbi:hypothetical protein HZH68_004194 [Vespula germanica]|uniref:Uncharacterized protein n=1 Tax=Vespula germanica TaxID=30212 RepID=A0A834KN94_VESGE|nr:hypothetical protein HZH68_004194 [Vespula germanica]